MLALITGAEGFVGAYLAKHLGACGDEVVLSSLVGSTGVALDVTNYDQCLRVISKFKPNWIFHLAGMSFAPDAERDFAAALRVNVNGTFNLLKACEEAGTRARVLAASSAEVYGKVLSTDLPIREELTPNPANGYSLSKLMMEQVARFFDGRAGVEVVIARAFNHIGPGQRADFVVPAFASQLAAVAKRERAAVIKVGNLEAKRDFSDVRDIVRGYRLALERGRGVYNFCSGRSVSVQWILDQLIQISELTVSVEKDPARMRKSDVPDVYGSFEKAKRELGWEPCHTNLSESLRMIYQSLQ